MAEKLFLKDLTMDQKRKAFERTLAKFEEPGVKLILITEEYYDLALTFARDYFMKEEALNKALGMQWSEELKEFWMNSFKLNLSLMFLNEQNGEPIALRTTRIARYDDKPNTEAVKDERIKLMIQLIVHCDQKANYFGHFPTKEAFHFLGLAVAPKYKRCGYASKIFKVAVDMIRNFGIDPVYLKVEGSSNFSKRIFEKAGCEMLFEQRFDSWEVDGKIPIQNTVI
ncbi:uncharacterized protein LOC123550024 isoform X2 [Mercenaria mercenaria]|uniref:uncharacterized protein LOC123550024 isoform X2 n=1 Tax=Mercenaria mercenaria TaxID=6596 RepID=UPI00234F7761|nr:uncharacterized protein LOC123550024 isoform X2 [Mercenaria mercenaria]